MTFAAKFRIQTDDVTVERRTTEYQAVQLAKDSSIFTDSDITVERENPMLDTGDQLNLGEWIMIGYACNGIFYKRN